MLSRHSSESSQSSAARLRKLFCINAAVVLGAAVLICAVLKLDGLLFRRIPKNLTELLARNPETEEFVRGYPQRKKLRDSGPLADEEIAHGIPALMQWDVRWGYEPYAGEMLGLSGCGPTCLSAVAAFLLQDPSLTPARIAAFSTENGYAASGSGSSWTLISEGARRLGLNAEEIPLVKSRIFALLEEGVPIICVMGAGDFTSSGHFLILLGAEDGCIRLHDPNSRERSSRMWEYERLESQFRNLWAIRLPDPAGN